MNLEELEQMVEKVVDLKNEGLTFTEISKHHVDRSPSWCAEAYREYMMEQQ